MLRGGSSSEKQFELATSKQKEEVQSKYKQRRESERNSGRAATSLSWGTARRFRRKDTDLNMQKGEMAGQDDR